MWDVILQILAVLGIILLCLLGLVVFLILVVLFIPVRYKFTGSYRDSLQYSVKITWILHMLSVTYEYPEPGTIIIKVCGIVARKIVTGQEQEEEQREDHREEAHQVEETSTDTSDNQGATSAKGPKSEAQISEKKEQKQEKKYTETSVYDKIKKILADIRYYWELLRQEPTQLLFGRTFSILLKVLYHIKPKIVKADLEIGTGEPDTTGYVLAIWGMLIPVLGNSINITPDFENKLFCGTWYVKGRVMAIVLLINVLKFVTDKQLKEFRKQLKREEK